MSVTLSLRVTCDKRKPGVKTPSSKEENLHFIVNSLRASTQNVAGCCEFLDELECAVDLKDQLEILRKGLKLLLKFGNEGEKQEVCYFSVLVEILLSLELKSPLRSGIIRILKGCENQKSTTIQEIISEGFKSRFATHENCIATLLKTANALCGCFDNFPAGVEGVRSCLKEAYKFILDGITHCKNVLREGGSPAQNTELCQCIHALVRASLHVCSLDQSADCDRSQLHQLADQLMSCNQLPLDTRTNCGLLVVLTGRHTWAQMLQRQLSSEDDLTSLCLFSGLLGCLTHKEITSTISTTSGLEPAIQLIFDSIINIHKRNPLQPTVTLSVARTLVSLSRLLPACGSPEVLPVLPPLLTYTWEHLEHVMDSVKHLAVTLLNNIVKLHSPEVDVYSSILTAIRNLPVWGRARHTALLAVIGRVPVTQLVTGHRDIQLLYQHLSQEIISSHAVNAFQELMRHHYQETEDKEEWKELWIRPLLVHLDHNPSVPLQQVLSKALAACPDIIEYVLRLHEKQVKFGTTLLCLRLSHRLGLLHTSGEDGLKWRGLIQYDLLHSAVRHHDEQTRLSCLSLVVETPKTSEAFTPNELKLIVEYVSHNLNWDNPASRQRNIALLGKFVGRFNDSQLALQRRTDDEASQLIEEYGQCKQALQNCCLENLFPGATYSRRVTALHLLAALKPTGTPELESALLACLADSYEDVKAMAVKLLTTTPGLLTGFTIPQKVLHVIEKGIEYAGGVKPPECLSAAYLLATLSHLTFLEETLSAIVEKYPYCAHLMNQGNIEYVTVYCLLLMVVENLTQQLRVAQLSLLKAASSAPLYGLLFAARLLLAQVNLKECWGGAWRQLISRLVELSFSCSEAVASVVNNDSPEGHFPMDFDFDPSEVCGSGGEEGLEGVTSQMVLLCSWRTVKEVSLLLGFLAEECSVSLSHEEAGLLSGDDLLRIGDHLTTLLAETKHRGAFEQAYVGFCKLVSRLWRFPSGNLQQLPLQWLRDTMEEISSNKENLCATRRSAGIPFMIQALISTQLEVEGPSSVEPWVSKLLTLAESPTVLPTTHIHALNILRALFRSTQLGETVGVFVERATIITISAFSAANWMERNSATLLLSALMTRVFGVPRSKSQDHLSWKNKMTGRIFFQRYPKLFGFFQEELKKASQSTSVNLHPSLYPVLLILGRLYPSSLEGTDSNVQLTQYIPDILVCAGSNIYKTRTLAARAMVALMTLPHFNTVIDQIIRPEIPANLRHGLILQVAHFLRQSDPKVDEQLFRGKIETWMMKLSNLLGSQLCCLELEAMFQVLNIICEKYFGLVPQKVWVQITIDSEKYLNSGNIISNIGSCLLQPTVCELILKVASKTDGDMLGMYCSEMLKHDMYEVQHVALDFIYCLNNDTDLSERFHEFFKSVSTEVKQTCKNSVIENSKVTELFAQISLNIFVRNHKECHPEDKAKILFVLRKWESVWNKILQSCNEYPGYFTVLTDFCRDSHEEVAINAMHCLTDYMSIKFQERLMLQTEELKTISKLIVDLSTTETSEFFHEPIYELMMRHFEILKQSAQPINRLQMYKILLVLSDSGQWQTVVDQVVNSEKDICTTAVLLLGLTLGQFIPADADPTDDMGKVFDKEELASDYEEYMLSKVCGHKFSELCAKYEYLQGLPLTPDLGDWLAFETGLTGSSMAEFIVLAKMKLLQIDSTDPCQFLKPVYQRLRLSRLKLRQIL